jgi:hypothetical protein
VAVYCREELLLCGGVGVRVARADERTGRQQAASDGVMNRLTAIARFMAAEGSAGVPRYWRNGGEGDFGA